MKIRSLAAALALGLAGLTARAADPDNPFKDAKVGDYATYAMTSKLGKLTSSGTVTQTVVKKSDKEVTIRVTGKATDPTGKEVDIPAQEQTVDLTKPYDPAKVANLPAGFNVKVEKGKEGKEKVKAGGKEYDATWTDYKVKAEAMGQKIDADMKVWMAKNVPGGMVKMNVTSEVAGQKLEMTMDLKETGNKDKK
jgi:hypothetical protein